MTRTKVKLAFIENINKRKTSYYKRLKGFLKKVHELNILCDVEIVVIIYSPYHDQPKVFPNHDVAINTCTTFREFSELEQSKKMVTQEKFTKQSIKKMEKQLQKVKKENRVSELTNQMYELLNGKDIPVGIPLNDINDLSYVINQNLKKIHEAIKAKDDEENSTSMMAPPTFVPEFSQMEYTMNTPLIDSSISMNKNQNYSVGFPQSPTLSELFDWILDDPSSDINNVQDPNQNNNF